MSNIVGLDGKPITNNKAKRNKLVVHEDALARLITTVNALAQDVATIQYSLLITQEALSTICKAQGLDVKDVVKAASEAISKAQQQQQPNVVVDDQSLESNEASDDQ